MTPKILLLIILFLCPVSLLYADDFDTMYDRFYVESYSLASPSKTAVDAILAKLSTDGSFTDINYSSTSPITGHLDNLNILSLAYSKTGNAYYQDVAILSKYSISLEYWIDRNHQSSNWWDREIGYPQTLSKGYVLMIKKIQSTNTPLYNKSITYLKAAYLNNKNMEAANGADKIMGAFLASVLTKSTTDLNTYEAHIAQLCKVQNIGQGVEADWMYGAHSLYGRQMNANYCVEYMNSLLRYLTFTKGSSFYKVANVGFLEQVWINGIQWYLYNNRIDPSQTGRSNSSTQGVSRLTLESKMLMELNGPQNAQMVVLYDRLSKGKNAANRLSGNKVNWRFTSIIHRRPSYYSSVRMTSTKTVGMESAPGQREMNYYGGSGVHFIFRTGQEYGDKSFFDVFNYRQWPGITAEQSTGALPTVHYGQGGQNGNNFAGGVTDGAYGAAGYIHQKQNVTARKAWFNFENEIVALGSGITQSTGSFPVYTTLNQTIQNGNISYSAGGSIQTVTSSAIVTNPDWIMQDSIAYLNIDATSTFRISSETRSPFTSKIFTVSIDHGTNPSNANYAYVVLPNTGTSSTTQYKSNLPLQVLVNNANVQAVYHKSLKLTQAIFYKADSLVLSDGRVVKVNAPSAILLKDSADALVVTVANPLCETSNPATLSVSINSAFTGAGSSWNGKATSMLFNLPQGDYAGQSTGKIFFANKAPVITILSPANKQSFEAPASVFIEAEVNDTDGSIASVVFFEGSDWIGNAMTAPYTLNWDNVAAGEYRISVKATDNMGGVTYNSVLISVSNAVVTSIKDDPLENKLYFYPNPTKGVLQFSANVENIELYNSMGAKVGHFTNPGEQVDLSYLPDGMYNIMLNTKAGRNHSKLVLQK